MTTSGIRIIKTKRTGTLEPGKLLPDSPDSESTKQRNMVAAVNLWILERSENRRVEGVFSDRRIQAWKVLQKNPT